MKWLALLLVPAVASAQLTVFRRGAPTTTSSSSTSSSSSSSSSSSTTSSSTSTTAGTTSTTIPNQSPNWAASMLGAWMLDEASGPRYNIQGNTARNLNETNGPWGNISDHIEGTAAINPSWGGRTLVTTDPALANMAPPFTCGFWVKLGFDSDRPLESVTGSTSGFSIIAHIWNWNWSSPGGTANLQTNTPAGSWSHAAWKMSGGVLQSYINGQPATNVTGTYVPNAGTTFVVAPNINSPMDEVWCAGAALANTSICRICSCGIKGEQCTCSGTTYTSSGRNAAYCGSCTLPACNTPTP